jgi:chemotaxis methyl-accepting protein methylase/PAS domain-containing protein
MKKTITRRRQKKQRTTVARKTSAGPRRDAGEHSGPSFPIIGLGASAGGLEALEQFLGHVPQQSGLGFVIVQHLDPTHKGIMVELLQRSTSMPVVQIKDRMKIEPDHVYVIPPNRDLSILRGVLHLLEPAAPRGLRLPIDFFFRSLADDRHEQSIGVILSGMGSDGTLGLRAIKEKAGAVFVQAPASAKFDSMPRMAIEAGLADVIAPVEELPGKIIDYLRHIPSIAGPVQDMAERTQSAFEKVVILLRAQTGHDFSLYKKSTISRRIERRMSLHQITKIADYVRYLRENSQESNLLYKELLIGVTSFFRDPSVWEHLKDKIIPGLFAARPQGGTIRAWTAGCSTGEEAYSLAIIFKEVLEKTAPTKTFSFQIFATDLDKDAIDKARAGIYPANIRADISTERLRRFFVKNERGDYSVKKEIREMVIFAPQNLVMHPPFTRLDIVTCRNLLIYLDVELQRKLMPLFHYSLNPGGVLLLGSAETVGTATDLFSPLAAKARLFRRLDTSRQTNFIDFPSTFARPRSDARPASTTPSRTMPSAPSLQSLADQLLLQSYSPAAVLVTYEGDILYVSGKTGKYLEPAAGKANWNLFAMSREGLGSALSEAFHKAVRQKIVVTLKDVKVGTNGGTQIVDITVQPVATPDQLRGMVMVVFQDVGKASAAKAPDSSQRTTIHNARLSAMAQELQQAHEDLQATRGEMQISQEELKSTNEELQSMNEELQSTNEELTTSKEEMQSMNEELQTVNHELQAKVDELSRTSNDMKNLLNSTDIATLFLDEALLVRRFTTQAASIIKLIPADVGRPVTDLTTDLDYPRLADDIRGVLRKKTFAEKQVSTHDGRWFTVRIMPYRTQEDLIDGVVITFADITEAKNLEGALRKAQSNLKERYTHQTAALGKARKNRHR